MYQGARHPRFNLPFDEAEIRRLCGDAEFERAKIVEASGAVREPQDAPSSLRAVVDGPWGGRFPASLTAERPPKPACSCSGPAYCRHVGALMLRWLHAPESFGPVPPPSFGFGPASYG